MKRIMESVTLILIVLASGLSYLLINEVIGLITLGKEAVYYVVLALFLSLVGIYFLLNKL